MGTNWTNGASLDRMLAITDRLIAGAVHSGKCQTALDRIVPLLESAITGAAEVQSQKAQWKPISVTFLGHQLAFESSGDTAKDDEIRSRMMHYCASRMHLADEPLRGRDAP